MKYFQGEFRNGTTEFAGRTIRKSKALWFKWQWAVFYEEKTYATGTWINSHIICDSRSDARNFARYKKDQRFARKVVIKRRLVQTFWEDYQDSFTYNAKGNGNGR